MTRRELLVKLSVTPFAIGFAPMPTSIDKSFVTNASVTTFTSSYTGETTWASIAEIATFKLSDYLFTAWPKGEEIVILYKAR